MKKTISLSQVKFYLSVLAVSASTIAHAAQIVSKGQVEFIRTHDATAYPAWAPPIWWVTLKGVNTAGTCARFNSGSILFVGKDKQELSLAMAAQMSGQELEIVIDDTVTQNGFCAISHLTIGNPAPTY